MMTTGEYPGMSGLLNILEKFKKFLPKLANSRRFPTPAANPGTVFAWSGSSGPAMTIRYRHQAGFLSLSFCFSTWAHAIILIIIIMRHLSAGARDGFLISCCLLLLSPRSLLEGIRWILFQEMHLRGGPVLQSSILRCTFVVYQLSGHLQSSYLARHLPGVYWWHDRGRK